MDVLKLLLPQTGQGFNGIVLEEHYGSEWMKRYWFAWHQIGSSLQSYGVFPRPIGSVSEWDLYQLPFPFKRIGDGWFALFNNDVPRNLRISLVRSFRLGEKISCVCFNKNGEYVAAATHKPVKIIETRNGTEIESLIDDSQEAKEVNRRSVPYLYKCRIVFGPSGRNDGSGE